MNPNCHRFNELLMDFVYGELSPDEEAGLKTHAADCADCRRELASISLTRRMSAGLEMVSPPASLDQRVLAMADEILAVAHAPADSAMADASVIRPAAAPDGPDFFERLHAFLFRPAMATAGLAAAIAGTLFILHRNEAPSMLDAHPTGAPFEGAATATAIQNEAKASSRIPEGNTAFAPMPSPVPETDSRRASSAIPAPSSRPATVEVRSDNARAKSDAISFSLPAGSGNAAPAEASASKSRASASVPEMASEKKEAAAFPAAPILAKEDRRERSAEAESLAEDQVSAASPARAPSSARPQSHSASFTSGLSAFNRGDCSAAIGDFQRVLSNPSSPSAEIPAANHYIARCESRSGRCGKAALYFDAVLSRYPGYVERPQALYEAAECQRKLGNTARARTLLLELRTHAAWTDRADARLRELTPATKSAI